MTCQIIDNIFVYVHKVNITAKSEKNCDAMNKSENYTHITYKKVVFTVYNYIIC